MMAPPPADDLAQLLARCALKDRRAFEQLYRQSSAQLFGLIVRIVRDREWAGDILQESYVKVWHHAGDFTPTQAQPLTWMGAIARHQAIDALRRAARRPQTTVDVEELHSLADEADGPAEHVEQNDRDQQLHTCLNELAGEQRQAVELAYFAGLTHEELAARLGRPLGTVKSWVRRGLLRLKECLERCAT